MNAFKTIALCAALLATTGAAQAVSVTSYDIVNARPSGFGGWSHDYTGAMLAKANGTFDYTGGSGSLNDGVIPLGLAGMQLFNLGDNVTIKLHLDGPATLQSISLFGANGSGNSIPGTLTGWSVSIGASTQAFSSTAFGPRCAGTLCNDSVSLVGTGLDLIATDTVTLSGFQGGWSHYFSIAEVGLTGVAVAAVPEPETYALMFGGLLAVGFVARRRQAR